MRKLKRLQIKIRMTQTHFQNLEESRISINLKIIRLIRKLLCNRESK